MQVKFKYNELKVVMFLHDKTDKLSRRVKREKKFWDEGTLEQSLKYVNKESTVVDCGANIGNNTVFWGLFCKKVISFEPFPPNFDLLQKNIEANSINAEAHKIVVSDRIEKFSSTEITPNLGGIRYLPNVDGEYHSDTLDNMVTDKVDLLKIDVEGEERIVLNGASRILQEDHPVLFIEIHFIRNDMDVACMNVLKKYGYKEGVDVFLARVPKHKSKGHSEIR